MRLETGRRW